MNTKTTVISQAKLDAQFACCDKVAAYWQTKGRTPTAYVETYGSWKPANSSSPAPGPTFFESSSSMPERP